ncbi:MAG TPA: DUF2723 domain-containing protein, partial [Planctomycetes bacterium]|nr:DUF2723 domain-containing protein [Planctomycetota bacterium]
MSSKQISIWRSYAAVFFVALAFYVISCAPGSLWQDSGMYQYRILHNDIEGRLGLALAHPLYHLIGIAVKHIPLGEFTHRVNLISAVAGALAVANLFLLLRLWLGVNLPAVLAAVTFGLCWTTWQFSSIAETYMLYIALFLAELTVLFLYVERRQVRFLYLLALFNGLAVAAHMWGSIAFVCYVVFLVVLTARREVGVKWVGVCVLLWVVGALPYEYLIIRNLIESGGLSGTLASALFGNSWRGAVLNASLSTKLMKENSIFILYNFSTPNALLCLAGLYALGRVAPSKGYRYVLLSLLVMFFLFAFRYTVPDRYAFFLPFYSLVCILIGVGFKWFFAFSARRSLRYMVFVFTLVPVCIYAAAPLAARHAGFVLPVKRTIPYRDDYKWFLRPWKTNCTGPDKFAEAVFNTVEDDAIIYADGTTVYPLLLSQELKGTGQTVRIVSSHPNRQN